MAQIQCQSSAPRRLVIRRSPLITINGTPDNTSIEQGSSFDVLIGGATGFGRSNRLDVSTDSTIGPADPTTGTRVSTHFIAPADLTFSSGVFRVANSGNIYDALRLFVPGFKYVIGYTAGANLITSITDNNGRQWVFKVLDLTQDNSFTYISTDLAAYPSGVTFASNTANAIFAYGVKYLGLSSPAFLNNITAFVEPVDVVVGSRKRHKHVAFHT
jgi:hypothetical protein